MKKVLFKIKKSVKRNIVFKSDVPPENVMTFMIVCLFFKKEIFLIYKKNNQDWLRVRNCVEIFYATNLYY